MGTEQSGFDPDENGVARSDADNRNYILVTPAKDEEHNLPRLIACVRRQTIRPSLWVVVNDGSTDRTASILDQATARDPWIRTIELPPGERYWGIHYSSVCKAGFDHAIPKAISHEIPFNFIGLVDADMVFGPRYFQRLIEEFERRPRLGILSGSLCSKHEGKMVREVERDDIPSGGQRLWRRDCFEEAGYVPSFSADSVSNVKAKQRGWEIGRIAAAHAFQSRRTSHTVVWKGAVYGGASDYYIGRPIPYAIAKWIKNVALYPTMVHAGYLFGYFRSLVSGNPQLNDEDVLSHFRTFLPDSLQRTPIAALFRMAGPRNSGNKPRGNIVVDRD